MKAPHEMNAYEIIVHEYAVECADHDRENNDAYKDATDRMTSDDALFREYCEDAEMTETEINEALSLKA